MLGVLREVNHHVWRCEVVLAKVLIELRCRTMNNPIHPYVILLENVSVRYRVPREKLSGIKEFVIRWVQRRIQFDEYWGLRDISFKVRQGEVFGIIGRNGAGKSTLLKIVARVLTPTEGRVVTVGRVAPILELGAGFHPELTGRENIFLNSALLGFSRREVEPKLEKIIEFAELGEFIDAPIRTYSTGMVARLGFAVATAIHPHILLIDEVLSVGDVSFQEKCIHRMNDFRDRGTTIVFVSHDMETVRTFCERAAWLDGGELQSYGDASQVVEEYIRFGQHG